MIVIPVDVVAVDVVVAVVVVAVVVVVLLLLVVAVVGVEFGWLVHFEANRDSGRRLLLRDWWSPKVHP